MPIDDLISVTIPAYNHEKYIEECIRSIMAQTYRNIELLIIDDGSKDGTFAKMQELKPECEKRFFRVVFETQENQGTRISLNRLIDLSEGKYVLLTASDDALKPLCVEKLHTFLSENPDYVLAVGDDEIINGDSERVYWGKNREILPEAQAVYKTFGDELHLNEPDNKHLDFGNYADLLKGNYLPNGFLCLRQAIIDAGKYNPNVFLEDWYMNLQLSKQGKFKYIPEILFSYRWHTTNTISNPAFKAKSLEIFRQIYEHEKEYCFTHGYKKQWKRQWCKRFGWRAKWKKLRDFIRGKK
ncbi:MAG: glycosyltransferase family 2 protein [Alphaproteobacteria bacterium]|nr:glycosyltransferase family 2 protein [Alphaproteobacteria bacterium]